MHRFTEELFATLIAFIFIFNAFKNISEIGQVHKFAPSGLGIGCQCKINDNMEQLNVTKAQWALIS